VPLSVWSCLPRAAPNKPRLQIKVANISALRSWPNPRATSSPDCINADCATTFGGTTGWSTPVALPSNPSETLYVVAVCLNAVFDCQLYVSLNFNNTSPTATDPPVLTPASSPIAPQPSVSGLVGITWCSRTTVAVPCLSLLPSRFELGILSDFSLFMTATGIATAGQSYSYVTSKLLQPDATFSVQYALFAGTGSGVSSLCTAQVLNLNSQAAPVLTASCRSLDPAGRSTTCSYVYSNNCSIMPNGVP
jgi:hypothetical protein